MKENFAIAIDGPASSGKSTVSKKLAKKLGIIFLSTGSIYRALGLKCKMLGLDAKSEEDVQKVLNSKISFQFKDGNQLTFLDGENVSSKIQTEEIGTIASLISQHKCVREKCVQIQRDIASKQSIVVDGRDIGSVVLPDAKYKFYLDADINIRAKRRFEEMKSKNIDVSFEHVLNDLQTRDYNDIHRKLSPLVLCKDAIIIDSSNLSIDQVVEKFLKIIRG